MDFFIIWKHDANPQAGIIVLQGQVRAVKVADRRDKAEAETVAFGRAALFQPVKPAQDVFTLGHRNPRPVIGNAEHNPTRVA